MQESPEHEDSIEAAGGLDWLQDGGLPTPLRPHVLTVTELTRRIRQVLEGEIGPVTVEGEISNWRPASSGHIYFVLKDGGACIRCVMFRSAASRLGFAPGDGMKVEVAGQVSVYEARGEYQILVDRLVQQGLGALFEAFLRLKAKLEKEGLFDPEHKKPLPFLPRRIGVITSMTGAAIRDILNVLQRRFANLHVILWPAKVQGDGAAAEIAHALDEMDRRQLVDVIICGRGGGSIEDLWPFNEERVARAIYRCETPVISAVGHEIDFTIADFVADLRAPTPSAAAELVIGNQVEICRRIESLERRLEQMVVSRVRYLRSHLKGLLQSYALEQPRFRLRQLQQRTDELLARIERHALHALTTGGQRLGASRERLAAAERTWLRTARQALGERLRRIERAAVEQASRARLRLGAFVESLEMLGPHATLRRGYSLVVHKRTGQIVRSARQVKMNDPIEVQTGDGSFPALATPPLKAEQPDLFRD
jgi:exodeoxyribonuclease VII large subunit